MNTLSKTNRLFKKMILPIVVTFVQGCSTNFANTMNSLVNSSQVEQYKVRGVYADMKQQLAEVADKAKAEMATHLKRVDGHVLSESKLHGIAEDIALAYWQNVTHVFHDVYQQLSEADHSLPKTKIEFIYNQGEKNFSMSNIGLLRNALAKYGYVLRTSKRAMDEVKVSEPVFELVVSTYTDVEVETKTVSQEVQDMYKETIYKTLGTYLSFPEKVHVHKVIDHKQYSISTGGSSTNVLGFAYRDDTDETYIDVDKHLVGGSLYGEKKVILEKETKDHETGHVILNNYLNTLDSNQAIEVNGEEVTVAKLTEFFAQLHALRNTDTTEYVLYRNIGLSLANKNYSLAFHLLLKQYLLSVDPNSDPEKIDSGQFEALERSGRVTRKNLEPWLEKGAAVIAEILRVFPKKPGEEGAFDVKGVGKLLGAGSGTIQFNYLGKKDGVAQYEF